jgi:predicted nucleic acid-binding protein
VILIDTSAWIDFFRGDEPLAGAVDAALNSDDAALCGPVVTEIRRGLRVSERARVLPLLEGCHLLTQPEELWVSAGDLGSRTAARGLTLKTLDLLIAVYAIEHGTPLLARDGDFEALTKMDVGLSLVRA